MYEPEIYVVRIYRRESAEMAGVVESVSSGLRTPFRTTEDLWRALREAPNPGGPLIAWVRVVMASTRK